MKGVAGMDEGEISIDDLPLRYEVGDSVLEQFALSHTPSDILRELVQNEYDAAGHELDVNFGRDRLVITGTGNPIDSAGWKRLQVMLGTGRVQNLDTYIEPKESSIGSKNFGLRSLFTVGDAIWVTSGGKWSVLHCGRGALYPPRDGRDSAPRGVRIEVPYRRSTTGALEPFTPKRRSAWVREIGDSVAETLIKLAHPERSRSLRRAVLKLDGKALVAWTQRAEEVPIPVRGVQLVRRHAVQESYGHRESMVELEYQARIQIPKSHRQKDFPSYFRSSRNRVCIAVSIRVHRGRPDIDAAGLVFYPLGAPLARTGNLVSLNAPFEMDNNRANIVSPLTSSWNEWLIHELVDLTVRLLTADWYARFGAGAYLALEARGRESGNQLTEAFADALVGHLRSGRVWAARRRNRGKLRFVTADDMVQPDRPDFDGLLDHEDYLDAKLAKNDKVVGLALECGVKRFGPDSLVRLRCAGQDASGLRTKPSDQGNWFFRDFDRVIRQRRKQIDFARALDRIQLTASHKADLLNSPTTLAADGSLGALSDPLYIVSPDAWKACPVNLSQRLHPDLAKFRSLSGLAKKFNMTPWIRDTARRAQKQQASDEERVALMNVILARRGKFDAATRSLLRKSPVLLDHRRRWVEPRKITLRRTRGARLLSSVLSFPARSYAKDSELSQNLSFRTEVDGEDVVRLAEWVSSHPDTATRFEASLHQFRDSIRPGQWRRLSEIACLRSSRGTLQAPQDLYIKTRAVVDVLGDHASYVEGRHRALKVQMGCNVLPRSVDIAAVIAQHRHHNSPVSETLYVALVEALQREGRSVREYAGAAIVWTNRGYVSPSEALVRSRDPELFNGAVAVACPQSAKAADALKALGCRVRPTAVDWAQLIASISQSAEPDVSVANSDKSRLLRAYAELQDGIPDDVKLDRQPFVLGRDGRLHHPSRTFIDDYPKLAAALGERVAIAEDSSQAALQFYGACGIRRLREAAVLSQSCIGDSQNKPNRIGAIKTKRQLDSIIFRSALLALINREITDRPGLAVAPLTTNALPTLRSLVFVDSISHYYQLDEFSVAIEAHHHWDGTTLYVMSPESRTEFRDSVSFALAEEVTKSSRSAQMIVSPIYRLLECNTTVEIADFLARRGISWQTNPPLEVWESDSEAYQDRLDTRHDGESIAERIVDSVTTNLISRADQAEHGPSSPSRNTVADDPDPKSRELPPIDEVVIQETIPTGTHTFSGAPGSGGRAGGGSSSRPDPDWDRILGQRGEEIVYLRELERVREAGTKSPDSLVRWVSRDDPTADHDIRSVAEDGSPLWIEVKSTSGMDGNFDWPESEVAKALRERERYILCRVYRVNSVEPLVKRFRDPLSMVESGRMRLVLGSVRARVEPADAT